MESIKRIMHAVVGDIQKKHSGQEEIKTVWKKVAEKKNV